VCIIYIYSRDLEGELDGRRLLYDKTAQLCEDKRYRELIVELQVCM